MSDIETKRISELIAAQDISDSDLFVIEQGGAAKKALGSVVKGAIGGSSLPSGGTPGQVLTKTATGETWDDVSGLPDGGNNGQVLTKTSSGAEWSDAGTPTQAQTDSAVADWLDAHPEATTTVQDGSITEEKLDPYLTAKVNGGGISDAVKVALLNLLEKVAYTDDQGQTYLDALETALYPPANLLSISAVFNQGQNTISDTDTLDDLKQYLTVTANYDNGTTETVTTYVLNGTLVAGTSTITVTYGGKTAAFGVTVTHDTTVQIESGRENYALIYSSTKERGQLWISRTNCGVTVEYTMDAPMSVLYPAGIIPTNGTRAFPKSDAASIFVYDASGNHVGHVNENPNRWVQDESGTMAEFSQSWSLSGGVYTKIQFNVDMRYRDRAYMYDKTTGQVWFAGKNTPYYGMSNISEAGGV